MKDTILSIGVVFIFFAVNALLIKSCQEDSARSVKLIKDRAEKAYLCGVRGGTMIYDKCFKGEDEILKEDNTCS